VLDVGCGCGATSVDLAIAVRPQGTVLGLDVSEPMLARARERSKAFGHARFVAADAATYAFDAAHPFDLLFSRFGVMFFREPEKAFTHLRSALTQHGRLTFVCWRARAENPWMTVPLEAATTVVPAGPPPNPEDPGPFAFANPDRVKRILTAAGFKQIQIDPFDQPLSLGKTLDDAVTFGVEAGPTARLLEEANASQQPHVRQAIREALGPHLKADGVTLASAVWIVTARA
jgi:SAM-dependent methyltransferase